MRVWQLNDSANPPALIAGDIPLPAPGPGEVLVRVHAAGVTLTELTWYPTTHAKSGELRHRAVPSHEFSGTIAALGSGASGFSVRDEVFGMNDWFADGATADYCVTHPEFLSAKPPRLSHAEAASVPIGALTAWQGLFDRAKIQPGERVLVHGGSGAVGLYAVQFASRHGAHVTTTASARNADFLRQLGAEQVLDYHTTRFEDHASGFDIIFDTVGGDTLLRSWPLLTPNGRMVTIVSMNPTTADERTKNAFFIVEPKGDQLAKIAGQLQSGEIQPVVDAIIPFTEASLAYLGKPQPAQPRLGRGKVVVAVAE